MLVMLKNIKNDKITEKNAVTQKIFFLHSPISSNTLLFTHILHFIFINIRY